MTGKFLSLTKLTAALFAALMVLTLFINLSIFDETLEPEVAQLITRWDQVLEQRPSADNAFFSMLALTTAQGNKMAKVGVEIFNEAYSNFLSTGESRLDSEKRDAMLGLDTDSDIDAWQNQIDWCARSDKKCLQKLAEQIPAVMNSKRVELLLSRYRELQELPYYQEMPLFQDSLPMLTMYRLSYLNTAIAYQRGQMDQLVRTIEQEIRFWQKLTERPASVLTNMLSIAVIRQQLYMINDLIDDNQLDSASLKRIQNTLQSLHQDNTNLGSAFELEFYYHAKVLQRDFSYSECAGMFGVWCGIIIPTFQNNASINVNYNYHAKPLMNLASKNSRDVFSTLDSGENVHQPAFSFSPTSLYNLGGKFTNDNVTVKNASDYIARAKDFLGLSRLVSLKVAIKLNEITNIEAFVKQSVLKDPYQDKAFRWDQESSRLYFDCLDKRNALQKDCELTL